LLNPAKSAKPSSRPLTEIACKLSAAISRTSASSSLTRTSSQFRAAASPVSQDSGRHPPAPAHPRVATVHPNAAAVRAGCRSRRILPAAHPRRAAHSGSLRYCRRWQYAASRLGAASIIACALAVGLLSTAGEPVCHTGFAVGLGCPFGEFGFGMHAASSMRPIRSHGTLRTPRAWPTSGRCSRLTASRRPITPCFSRSVSAASIAGQCGQWVEMSSRVSGAAWSWVNCVWSSRVAADNGVHGIYHPPVTPYNKTARWCGCGGPRGADRSGRRSERLLAEVQSRGLTLEKILLTTAILTTSARRRTARFARHSHRRSATRGAILA